MRKVFYSFHYEKDVFRVQQIRNMGVLEGNVPAEANQWEEIKKSGKDAIRKWIDKNMESQSCVIVLIGEDTASREWVKYEIKHAWETGKALMGIYINNLNDPKTGKGRKGRNPFDNYSINGRRMSEYVPCHNPNPDDAYNDIKNKMESWIEDAIANRKNK